MKLLIFLLSLCAVSYCITNNKLSNTVNPNFLGLSQDEITPSNDPVYSTPDTTAVDDVVTENSEEAEVATTETEVVATETDVTDTEDEEEEEQSTVGTADATVGTEEEAEEGWELLDGETIQNTTVIQTYLKEGSEQAIEKALNDGVIPDDYYFVRKINKVERQQVLNANNDVVESVYRYDLDTSNGKGTNVAVTYEVEYNEATQEGEIKNIVYKAKVL